MMQFLLGLAILLAVTVVPVMIAARVVGARKTGFGSAVFALFLQLILGGGLLQLGPGPTVALIAVVIGGALIYAFALETTILRGFIVSLLVGLITAGIALLIGGSLLTGSAVMGTP